MFVEMRNGFFYPNQKSILGSVSLFFYSNIYYYNLNGKKYIKSTFYSEKRYARYIDLTAVVPQVF